MPNTLTHGRLRVFVCYASEDRAFVLNLHHRLTENGFLPWLDVVDLLPGQDWELGIRQAIGVADAILVCLSHSAITKRGFVQKEVKLALDAAAEQPEGALFIIPARLEECEVPERLRLWQWVDLFRPTGYERIVESLLARSRSLGLPAALAFPEGALQIWTASDLRVRDSIVRVKNTDPTSALCVNV